MLYNGESHNSNYDDLLWVHRPWVGNWSWQGWGGTSSKNRLESPLHVVFSASSAYWWSCTLVLVVPKPPTLVASSEIWDIRFYIYFLVPNFNFFKNFVGVKGHYICICNCCFSVFLFLFVFFRFLWHFGFVSWFWFHLMYIRRIHGFLQLLYMYSRNCGDRFLFLCCQSVSILVFCQLGFYCRFLLVVFHF